FVANFVGEMNLLEAIVVAPDEVKVGALRLACQGLQQRAPGTAVRLGLRPEEVDPRRRARRPQRPSRQRGQIPLSRRLLARGPAAGCRAKPGADRRLLRQRHAGPRYPPRSDPDGGSAAGAAARVRRRSQDAGMTVVAALPSAPRRRLGDELLMRAAVAVLVVLLVTFIALPLATLLAKSFQDASGRFVAVANYGRYFATPALVQSLWNSLAVALLATGIVVPLAFVYAYGLTRTLMPAKTLFVALALL